jgi:hypothetical protein
MTLLRTLTVKKKDFRPVSNEVALMLESVFAQLKDFGFKRAEYRPFSHRVLTRYEKYKIRKQLRRDLRASLILLQKSE